MKRWLPKVSLKDFGLVTLSGVLYVLCFPEWDISPLVWVCLLPWFCFLHRRPSLKATFFMAAWLSLVVGVGGFHWITYAMHEFGNLPYAVCLLGLFLFSLGGQPQFYLYAILRRTFTERFGHKPGALRIVLLALGYTACDFVVPKLFKDTLGHAFLGMHHVVQAADVGGVYGLTFLGALSAEFLCTFLLDTSAGSVARGFTGKLKARRAEVLVVVALLGATEFYGWKRATQLAAAMKNPAQKFTIAAIQANIGDIDKIASETGNFAAAEKIVGTYLSMSEKALTLSPRPAAIIWPETAYPSLFGHAVGLADRDREMRIQNLVIQNHVPLLFGGYDSDGRKDFNSLFILTPESMRVYHKNVLLPFGEFIPIVGGFKWVEKLFPQVGNFGLGPGPEAIPVKLGDNQVVRFGPVICYEALFPEYTRASALQGNQVILNITNDSWFGPVSEPQLHLRLTVFRSIETRLPQIRATNTGISTLILPDGRLQGTSEIGKAAILDWTVPVLRAEDSWSLHRIWGDWFGSFSVILILVFLIRHEYPRRRKTRSPQRSSA